MAKKQEKHIRNAVRKIAGKMRPKAKTKLPEPSPATPEIDSLDFDALVSELVAVDTEMRAQTSKAINMGLTIRNWLYGVYILFYEQNGSDRAAYGERLINNLSDRLQAAGRIFDSRTLRLFRQFAKTYPQIGKAIPGISIPGSSIWQSLIAKSAAPSMPIRKSAIAKFELPGDELLEKLSFTALAELIQIDDPLKHIGQLNSYVTWYKKNIMQKGDNPPIGILLCTKKSDARESVVEYALAGMDNKLFVSRYAVKLPKKEDMERLLAEWTGAKK